MPENLVIFQKQRTQIKIYYWKLRPRYWEFHYEITCKGEYFGVISDNYIKNIEYAKQFKTSEVEK